MLKHLQSHKTRPMKLPQFSLRDLFWLLAMMAMGLGWWSNHHSFQEFQRLRDEARLAEENAFQTVRESAQREKESERKLQLKSLQTSERERAVKALEDDYERYRKAYFYYRERLPPPRNEDET